MNIVVPMAGKSSSFIRSSFKLPRYKIKLEGKTIFNRSLSGFGKANYFFICKRSHYIKYDLMKMAKGIYNDPQIVLIEGDTDGQACTALCIENRIGTDDPLLIVSPMQLIDWNPLQFISFIDETDSDAGMVVTDSIICGSDPFYARIDYDYGVVKSVGQTHHPQWLYDCGVYYFKYGWYFIQWCKDMMRRNGRSNRGDFWVAPCMNDGIVRGKTIRPYLVDEAALFHTLNDVRMFSKQFPHWAER